ncbi:MAG: transcription elongation factor GreA [Candidatus Izemoplasmatales bacterium]|jgi:transcription elongation factor GreA|nr:transcription elongation factor GreA [Candidatus Izemoplasmatales bacterium]MDD3865366.1 transcription elongation factor GreA [Candidatus Izemoplasmatales bacterium]
MENTFKLTEAGFEKMKQELDQLKDVDRKKNLEALRDARAQGDLSENADYDAARDEQARIEARIKEIENILKHAEIIKETNSKIVSIGKTISLKFLATNSIKEYTVVGHLEANPLAGKISNESPIGKAIIGLRKGAKITYKAETGKEIKIEILDIK